MSELENGQSLYVIRVATYVFPCGHFCEHRGNQPMPLTILGSASVICPVCRSICDYTKVRVSEVSEQVHV